MINGRSILEFKEDSPWSERPGQLPMSMFRTPCGMRTSLSRFTSFGHFFNSTLLLRFISNSFFTRYSHYGTWRVALSAYRVIHLMFLLFIVWSPRLFPTSVTESWPRLAITSTSILCTAEKLCNELHVITSVKQLAKLSGSPRTEQDVHTVRPSGLISSIPFAPSLLVLLPFLVPLPNFFYQYKYEKMLLFVHGYDQNISSQMDDMGLF